MHTSDDRAIDGVTYELILTSRHGKQTLRLSSTGYARLLEAWRVMEARKRRRLTFAEFYDRLLRDGLKVSQEVKIKHCIGCGSVECLEPDHA